MPSTDSEPITDLSIRRTARLLTYAGALPFLALTIAIIAEWDLPAGMDAAALLTAYGAVIVSFLCGIHWQVGLTALTAPRYLLPVSNAITLVAWVLAFVKPGAAVLGVLIILLGALLLLDRSLMLRNLVSGWFFALRLRISLMVTALLASAVLALASRA